MSIDLEGWDLHAAARENRVDIARIFLIHGNIDPKHRLKDMVGSAWIDKVDENGLTPLHEVLSELSVGVE